jgi:hypothetical protein
MVKHEPEVRRANAKRYVDTSSTRGRISPWQAGPPICAQTLR